MSSISEIANELRQTDPRFKDVKNLEETLELLVSAKPIVNVTPEFRYQLLSMLHEHQEKQRSKKGIFSMQNRLFWYASIPVVAVVVLLFMPQIKTNNSTNKTTSMSSRGIKVSRLSDQAFGSLAVNLVSPNAPTARSAATFQAAESAKAIDTVGTLVAPPVKYTMYKYVYTGQDFDLTETNLAVLERQSGNAQQASSDLLNLVGGSTIDLRSFGNLDVQNITLGKDGNYTISVNGFDGSIGIYRNGNIKALARDTNDSSVPSGSQLSDDEVIAIAKKFLGDHGISLAAYGDPKVMQPSVYTLPAADAATKESSLPFYGGDQQVIFPLQVNDTSVFGLWGDLVGLNVMVSTADKQVSSVYGLTTQQYASSSYPAMTDRTAVVNIAERGGIYGIAPDQNADIVEAKLGTPTRVLVNMFRYDSNQSHDLLVPALRFPVINPSAGMNTSIVVPLVKDLLDDQAKTIEPAVPTSTNSSGQAVDGSTGSSAETPKAKE